MTPQLPVTGRLILKTSSRFQAMRGDVWQYGRDIPHQTDIPIEISVVPSARNPAISSYAFFLRTGADFRAGDLGFSLLRMKSRMRGAISARNLEPLNTP